VVKKLFVNAEDTRTAHRPLKSSSATPPHPELLDTDSGVPAEIAGSN
jgi:hypothetical protein